MERALFARKHLPKSCRAVPASGRFIDQRLFLAAALCVLIAVSAIFQASTSAAADVDDAKSKYRKLQDEIDRSKEELDRVKLMERVTLDELDDANRKLAQVSRELNESRATLDSTRRRVAAVESEVRALEARLKRNREWMGRKLRAMSRHGRNEDIVTALASADDIAEFMRKWKYLEVLAASEHDAIEGYLKDLRDLKQKKEELRVLYKQAEDETSRVSASERRLLGEKRKKERMLASVRGKRSTYERMLKDLMASSNKLSNMIREYESRGSYTGKGFRELRGRLPWPARGRVAIPYGTTKDPRFETPVFRNGIYISVEGGEDARAVHKGEVVYADWFKGYGHLVILNHGGGYHTLYANLSEIFLKAGDIIESKGRVGKVGESGMLNSSSLYFEIRYKGKALNPAQWLLLK